MTETQAAPAPLPASDRVETVRRRLVSPLLQRGYFLTKMPLALFAGVRLEALDAGRCVTSVRYGWRSTNPFRSTYFAALGMAAEMSTGALGALAVESAPQSVAMLIVGLTGGFEKKAVAKTTFVCEEGAAIAAAVAQAQATGEAATATVATIGRDPAG
ncbi:MAG TPA: DUF4442 domain-containing protein, partial [Thermoanaerobaculia bacterium]